MATTVKADETLTPATTEVVTTSTSETVKVTPVIDNDSQSSATNLSEPQPEASQEAIKTEELNNTSNGNITVTNVSDTLNTAITRAEQEGVEVKVEPVKDYGVTTSVEETAEKLSEIEADYTKQATEIANVTEKYVAEKESHTAATEKVIVENNQLKQEYDTKISEYNDEVKKVNSENAAIDAAYEKARQVYEAEVANITAANNQAKEQYEVALVKYKADVERINAENEEKRLAYESAKSSYNTNIAEIEAENNLIKKNNQSVTDAYNKAKAIYDVEKEKYDKSISEARQVLEIGEANSSTVDNTYKSGVWTNLKSQVLSNGIKVVADGDVTQLSDTQGENSKYKIYIVDTNGVVDNSHVIRSVNIVSPPIGDAVTKTGDETWELQVDKWVTLPNAVLLADGTTRDLELKVSLKNAQHLYRQDIVALSSRNGIIQISNSAGESVETAESIVRSYRIKDSTDKYLWADISLDLDGGQQHFLLSSDSVVVSVGGGVKYDGQNITTDPYLGFKFGKNPLPKPVGWGDDVIAGGLDNENSLPDGAIAVVSYGSDYIVETRNITGYLTTGMVVGDFGISADLTSHIIGTPPKEPVLKLEEYKTPTLIPPVTPDYEELPEAPTVSYKDIPEAPEKAPSVPLPIKPEEPIYKELPTAPKRPTISYHYATLQTKPHTEKTVETTEGVNVDKGLVAKGQEIVFDLKIDSLPANRSLTTSGVLTDPLPKGFVLNLEKTVNASTAYALTYSEDNHVLNGLFTKKTIQSLNADLTKVIQIPNLKVYGWVSNDAATYKNTFTLDFNGGEGKVNGYTRTSNTVVVHTPGDPNDPDNPTNNEIIPLKANTNADGVKIDGKVVPIGGVNYYTITLDYDQYNAVKADKETIAKGFGAFDDYPEEALQVDLSKASIIDSDGQAVSGVTLADNLSINNSSPTVQSHLMNSGIGEKIKGAFISITADDPQAYYETIVKAKKSVRITIPMVVKDSLYNTGKSYSNTAYQLDFGNGYKTNTVTNTTPVVKPTKVNTNASGTVINGKYVLANSVNYYKVSLDYSHYKGIEADSSLIAKGFFGVDDYPEEALTVENSGIQLIANDNSLVKGVTTSIYANLLEAPKTLQEAMKKQGFKPKGAVLVFSADDPQSFYDTYVKTGMKITATLPMTVKADMAKTGGQYENTAYQIDFGSAYVTDTVVNNVPKLEPKKDIIIDLSHDTESLAGQDIKVGTTFDYLLEGAELPADRGSDIFSYTWFDNYDEKRDQYDGVYKILAPMAFKTKDGISYAARTELTRYAIQTVDTATGKTFIKLDEDFLRSIDSSSAFKADLYLQMKRVGTGDVYNSYTHGVNGAEVESNTTVSHTPVGDVTVSYKEKGGKELKQSVVDTPEGPTGRGYDTTDNRLEEIITEDGKVYKLVPELTEGKEMGTVSKGNTNITYVYEEVKADVLINYTDEAGKVIKQQVKDVVQGSIGSDYDTTDNRPEIIEVDGVKYKLMPKKTIGNETGKLPREGAEVTYVYHKIVTNWVEEGTRDNLKPQEDGEKERGSFEGYEYVEKEVDEETGDITYVFKKIPQPVPAPEKPKPTPVAETPKPQPAPVVQAATLPATGEESSVGYVALGMVAMTAAAGLAVTNRRKEEN